MTHRSSPGPDGEESLAGSQWGSAIAEFVMVAGLLLAVFLSVLQLTLVLHVRNTLLDAAATGARYGTLADRGPDDGAQLTRELISTSLGPRFASDVSVASREIGGRPGLEVSVRTGFPLVGFFQIGAELSVTAEAVRYGGG